MKSDIQIARETPLKKITEVASSIGISRDDLHTYGHYMAKAPVTLLDDEKIKKSNLILVTAITPTKAGIGKTTVSIGLALGLNRIGKKAIVALREPSLGPVFGMKGGCCRRRLFAGITNGKHQPTLHRRFPRHYFGTQYHFGTVG